MAGPAPSPSPNRARRVALGTAAAVVAQGLQVASSLLLVPLALRHLGRGGYDLWLAVAQAAAYLSLAELGLGGAVQNVVTEARARGDEDRAARAVWTAAAAMAAAGLPLALLGALALPALPVESLLATPPSDPGEFRLALGLLVALSGLRLPLGAAVWGAHGLQEGYRVHALVGLVPVATLAGAAAAFAAGGGLVPFAAVAGGAQTLALLAVAWDQRRRWPALRGVRPRLDRALVPVLARGSPPFAVLQVAALLVSQSQVLLLLGTLPAGEAAPYVLPARLFALVHVVVAALLGTLWPTLRDLHARGDRDRLREVYARIARLAVGVSAGGAAALLAFGRPLLGWWVPAIPYPGTVLMALFALHAPLLAWNTWHASMASALGRPGALATVAVVEAGAYLTAAALLVGPHGREGLGIALLGAALLPTGLLLPALSTRP
ncbi:MAG: hypothetical protein L0216_05240, partial [Planctomycetales bacterium]|nr:hypothetical protein [Planctomycetales bacterium]